MRQSLCVAVACTDLATQLGQRGTVVLGQPHTALVQLQQSIAQRSHRVFVLFFLMLFLLVFLLLLPCSQSSLPCLVFPVCPFLSSCALRTVLAVSCMPHLQTPSLHLTFVFQPFSLSFSLPLPNRLPSAVQPSLTVVPTHRDTLGHPPSSRGKNHCRGKKKERSNGVVTE